MTVKMSDRQIYLDSSVCHSYVSSYPEQVHSIEVVTVIYKKTTMNTVYRETVPLALTVPRSVELVRNKT
jgi:hypothetical protein